MEVKQRPEHPDRNSCLWKSFPVWRENNCLKKVCLRVFKVLGVLGNLVLNQTNIQKRVDQCDQHGWLIGLFNLQE